MKTAQKADKRSLYTSLICETTWGPFKICGDCFTTHYLNLKIHCLDLYNEKHRLICSFCETSNRANIFYDQEHKIYNCESFNHLELKLYWQTKPISDIRQETFLMNQKLQRYYTAAINSSHNLSLFNLHLNIFLRHFVFCYQIYN